MAIVVANFFNNFKWGGAAEGSSGGQVTWSYGAIGATLADFNIGFEVTDPYFKEHIAYAFDVWESILKIDFKLVADSANPSIRLVLLELAKFRQIQLSRQHIGMIGPVRWNFQSTP